MNYLFLSLYLCFIILNLGYCYPGPKRILCPPLKLKNGKVKTRPRTFAQFTCNRGYLLAGEKYSKCAQGKWDTLPPICVRPSCQNAVPPKNGLLFPSHRGAVLTFFCAAGYKLQGPERVYCEDAKWSAHLPSCLPTNSTPSLSCDFEREDICGWTHDLNHNFDWTRMNFKTPSGHLRTGPSFDHTKGPGNGGYYMYIEATSRNINDTARLISPVYDDMSNNSCLVFYYHMYGSGIGQLKVYLKKLSESWVLNDDKMIYSRNGNFGNHWLSVNVMLGIITEEFQIIFEGIRGISYVSDIAIDDVSIGECIDDSTTTTEEPDLEMTTFSFESCENRCNQTKIDDITCSCDYGCYDLNTCCPDYVDMCLLTNDTSSYDTTTDSDTESTLTETSEDAKTITENPTINTETSKEKSSVTPIAYTTSPMDLTTVQVTKPNIIPSTKSQEYNITTTNEQSSASTTILALITKPMWKQTTWPPKPIKILPVPTLKPHFTTVRVTVPTKLPKIPYIDDIATVKNEVDVDPDGNEIIDVTEPPNVTKEYPEEKYPKYGSDKAAPIQEDARPTNKTTVIAVLAVCFLIFGILGLVFLAKKYSGKNCVNVGRMRNGNGDSQSDVRFLTNDEILDFRLTY